MAQLNVPYVLMHMRGDPTTMQQLTHYTDTCLEVGQELQGQAQAALDAGIEPWRIIIDPGVCVWNDIVLSDFHKLNIRHPFCDAQNKPAWRDKTCATHT